MLACTRTARRLRPCALCPASAIALRFDNIRRSLSSGSDAVNDTARSKPSSRVVFSGIQPTGIPHLGNFLGALLNWVQLQRDAQPDDRLIFSIVGWHALTLPQDPRALSTARREMMAVLLAIGLDPERSIVFHQDDNPNHTELAWILNCITPMGKLRRMTTWKSRLAASRNARDDADVDESLLNAGLFTYPVLQAADVLAYKTTHVPVGEDQQQHIELARDLADTFNRTFKNRGPLFPLPQHVVTTSRRVLSLKDPSSKMSKSAPDKQSRILLTDSALQIQAKVRAAVTDSITGITYDPLARPGASNLLAILAACLGEDVTEAAKRYSDKGHVHLKADVAEAVEEMMKKPRAEFERLREEPAYLTSVSAAGAAKARELSEATMREVRERVGLV
ncbi:Tryptophan--tRNA ligase, mitochondrial [Sparassis crispa]|uniref:Tryptophan--tRNA ligase, mitochondrial n=1 Tax=Sparassis crispa TaxID=139825 RepID=A0A401GKX6_9APHY|nr:Tryptophan--tRNA ligase, mitochondrial [Sparassis crispa]GBE82823.1 Tryptophan--tRNA ligase, mitochondrial [Sparassis crispa]